MDHEFKSFIESNEDAIRAAIEAGLFDEEVKKRAWDLDVCAQDARYTSTGVE